ncbi:hypothetical protein IMG5_175660 [Ichthyophthirius multifiliis]|uniref:Uncharacterized protein n=1 Tax=Ichthyophthirius multifiliis TaxID=5932 RepID=G0R273_ICHMU|nr:hypothetical protein IMG5_175660 [Ichthyophthirius multifiliis]EGR28428.1 hypothetical protein IMG5_175660 [Ichthyophthirius multifiliis]|eukprot:XP_004029664.1 hypothetical protein IMG5_175660 [Ichthyophthirius multifiliis]
MKKKMCLSYLAFQDLSRLKICRFSKNFKKLQNINLLILKGHLLIRQKMKLQFGKNCQVFQMTYLVNILLLQKRINKYLKQINQLQINRIA